MHIILLKVTSLTTVAFLQFLDSYHVSANAMENHLSAIKAKMAIFGLLIACFQDQRIKYL